MIEREHTSDQQETRRELLQENDSLTSVRASKDNENSARFDGHYFVFLGQIDILRG
jgi:hypothetical protein